MKPHRSPRFRLLSVLIVFFSAAFLLPAFRTGDSRLYLLAAAVPGTVLILMLFPSHLFFLDRPALSAALTLSGLGILAPAAVMPDFALSQGLRCASSLVFLVGGAVLVSIYRPSVPGSSFVSVCALGLLSCSLWLPEAGFSLSEGGIVLLLFAAASFLALRLRLAALAVSLAGLILLLLGKELPAALIWGLLCVFLFWGVSDSGLWSFIALSAVSAVTAGWIAFTPLADAPAEPAMRQMAEVPLLLPDSVSSASVSGTGSLYFLLGEQYGLIVLLCTFVLLLLLLLRGSSLGLNARKPFHASIALGTVLFFGLSTLLFLISAGGLLPFSSGDFPFLTASLPDLCTQFLLLGFLSGISSRNEADLEEDARLTMLAR